MGRKDPSRRAPTRPSVEPCERISTNLPVSLAGELRRTARARGQPQNRVMADALRAYFEELKRERVRPRRSSES